VKPTGILRFALTCRYIIPETLDNDQQREDARRKSVVPAHLADYVYNGDINAKAIKQAKGPLEDTTEELNHIEARVKAGMLDRNIAINMVKERLARMEGI